MRSSREILLEHTLSILQYNNALKAFDLVKAEMCSEKGHCRYDGSHFYYHCFDVAQKLLNFGIRDEDIITAALLHDIVEDVEGYTTEIICELFNQNVAKMVDLVSKKPNIDYKNYYNMKNYLDNISDNLGAALIKTADRMHNFGCLSDASLQKRMSRSIETKELFFPFFKDCRIRYTRYSNIFVEAKTQIEPHLLEIEEHYRDVEELENKINDLELKIKEFKC